MGKKAKSTKGALRAKAKKLDKSTLPPPPKPVTDEVRLFGLFTSYNQSLFFIAI
jgi:hypothetical protein